jgi:hypothetical protein
MDGRKRSRVVEARVPGSTRPREEGRLIGGLIVRDEAAATEDAARVVPRELGVEDVLSRDAVEGRSR